MEDILGKYPKLDGFISVAAWPQVPQSAYRRVANKYKSRIDKRELVLVIGDTLKMQMEILEDALSHGQVGQRPNEMGYRAMQVLKDLAEGKEVKEVHYTGLDICTQENATTCVGGL